MRKKKHILSKESKKVLGEIIFEGSKKDKKIEISDIETLKRKLGEKQTSSDLFILALDSLHSGSDIILVDEKEKDKDNFFTFEVIT